MRQESSQRFDVGSKELLERLVRDGVDSLASGTAQRSLFRDIFFDTADHQLERRGVICRFRISANDERHLRVNIREPVGIDMVAWNVSEARVPDVDPKAALQGTSEPARRLRGVTDPARLAARAELEIEEWRLTIRSGLLQRVRLEVLLQTVTALRGDGSSTFHEAIVRRVRPGGPTVDDVTARLQQVYNLAPVVEGRLERAERLLGQSESATAGAPPDGRVAVVALRSGEVALLKAGNGFRLPVADGHGEEVVRELLSRALDDTQARLQLLGGASSGGCNLEVWLAEYPAVPQSDPHTWDSWPFAAVLRRAGSPLLRDADSVAAINVASRFSLFTGFDLAEADAAVLLDSPPDREGLTAQESYLNPELSTLEFNGRVLELAADRGIPVLERLRFLSIFSANMDEFFMVRVGGLKRRLQRGSRKRSIDGLSAAEQLEAIAVRVRALAHKQYGLFQHCLPELEANGIRIRGWDELTSEERIKLTDYFQHNVFPMLTPHAITEAPGHPFPRLGNLRLAIAVVIADSKGELHFGSVNLPDGLPRFVPLGDGRDFIPLEEIIRNNLGKLYARRAVESSHCFRVTRSGDLELDEEAADSLLEAVEEEVRRRPFAAVVRLEVDKDMPQRVRDLLERELRFEDARQEQTLGNVEVQEVDGLMDLSALASIADLPDPVLHFERHDEIDPLPGDVSVFDSLRAADRLVYHPYESFARSVQRFISDAADDPMVTHIRLTLYRTGGESEIVDSLVRAAQSGKSVDVFVELKARFDEQRNVAWAKKLEHGGIHVVTGLVKLKTHAKTALVTRREPDGIRRYVHIGTGNYNAATAEFYTDLGLMSADQDLGQDLNDLFNELMGSAAAPTGEYRKILVAPTRMLPGFRAMIEREA
ncbi:MAG: polyphosphate kinase 1, partial [Gemmatimonadales bacterium]